MAKQDKFVTNVSATKKEFKGGMVRGVSDEKPNYLLLWQPMVRRWAEHMTRGAVNYGKKNWMKASGEEELERFKESALRHMYQYLEGDREEDHVAAVFFNLSGAEYVRSKLNDK